ncbi:MAG: GIY-YIG nuclease family protein [Methanohalobium sp.]|uniref:GIY-YIG nuclease family protein n=1 Tax=Methanohalobium sp. TaxID=2837493 RepID=UPI003979C77B
MDIDYSDKGIYCLVFKNYSCEVKIGKLGNISFKKGYHIYIGSALGSGGLKRVKRHISLSENKDKKPRWHIDYLHLNHNFKLIATVCAATNERYECLLAQKFIQKNNRVYIPNFGCSDCSCSSHLYYRKQYPMIEIKQFFIESGLEPHLNHLD